MGCKLDQLLVWIVIGLSFIHVFRITDAACTMPKELMNQRWMDSNKGLLQFTTWKLSGWAFSAGGQVVDEWEVVDNVRFEEDGYLALRSIDTFNWTNTSANETKTYFSYVCLKFTPKSNRAEPIAYLYYQLHDREPLAGNERVLVADHDGLTRFDEICDETYVHSEEEFRMIVHEGRMGDVRQTCPNAVLGKYDYTYTEPDGSTFCAGAEDLWDGCTNQGMMVFNYTACPKKMAYSAGGQVACAHHYTSETSGITYTLVINLDVNITEADTSRYACFASTSDNSEATVVPGGCLAGQTPDVFPVDKDQTVYGAKITTRAIETCPVNPPDDGDTSNINVPLAIGLGVGGLILLILIIIGIVVFCLHRRSRKEAE